MHSNDNHTYNHHIFPYTCHYLNMDLIHSDQHNLMISRIIQVQHMISNQLIYHLTIMHECIQHNHLDNQLLHRQQIQMLNVMHVPDLAVHVLQLLVHHQQQVWLLSCITLYSNENFMILDVFFSYRFLSTLTECHSSLFK